MAPTEAVEVADANRDVIVGIKVRVGRHASGDPGTAPLNIALQVAEEVGMPLMAHIDHPPPSYEEVIDMLRPGDVLTHAFRPFPNAPCTAQGTVKQAVLNARASAASSSTSATARARSPSRPRARCWRTASTPTRSRPTSTRCASMGRPSIR